MPRPPETTITATPANPTNSDSATFEFVSSEAGSTFECNFDGGGFVACTSPQNYTGLADGGHTFEVRATDALGNTDPTPASFNWTVDAAPPETTITATPANPTNSDSATFEFVSSEAGSTFECNLDGGGFVACTSPQNYTGLADGGHTFEVRATDALGNTDPTPASFNWTVDAAPPETTITATPANPTNSDSATFEFVSSEARQYV